MTEAPDFIACEDDLHHIVEWTKAWYDQALAANYVGHPYRPDGDVVNRLHQYYRAGLTPGEALQAYFGVKH